MYVGNMLLYLWDGSLSAAGNQSMIHSDHHRMRMSDGWMDGWIHSFMPPLSRPGEVQAGDHSFIHRSLPACEVSQ